MNRDEPKVGDEIVDHGTRTTIDGFDEDHGTWLRSGGWVCMSEFDKDGNGVWHRPSKTNPIPPLEMPVPADGPQQLVDAESRLRNNPTRYTTDTVLAELLADVIKKQAWLGGVDLDMLNRTSGPEAVRLARYLNQIGTETTG